MDTLSWQDLYVHCDVADLWQEALGKRAYGLPPRPKRPLQAAQPVKGEGRVNPPRTIRQKKPVRPIRPGDAMGPAPLVRPWRSDRVMRSPEGIRPAPGSAARRALTVAAVTGSDAVTGDAVTGHAAADGDGDASRGSSEGDTASPGPAARRALAVTAVTGSATAANGASTGGAAGGGGGGGDGSSGHSIATHGRSANSLNAALARMRSAVREAAAGEVVMLRAERKLLPAAQATTSLPKCQAGGGGNEAFLRGDSNPTMIGG
ncbi:unnamed protein product [Closterium sp. NIES-64]|nr:unnamed protein product [Closterium sp. NIES-64]